MTASGFHSFLQQTFWQILVKSRQKCTKKCFTILPSTQLIALIIITDPLYYVQFYLARTVIHFLSIFVEAMNILEPCENVFDKQMHNE